MNRAGVLRVLAAALCLVGVVAGSWQGPRPLVLLAVLTVLAGAAFVAWRLPAALTAAGGCVVLSLTVSLLFTRTQGVPWRAVLVAGLLASALLVADAAESLPTGAGAWRGLLVALRRRAVPALVAAAALAAVAVFTAAPPALAGAALVVAGMAAAAGAVLLLVVAARR
jgi:hypothetical protein